MANNDIPAPGVAPSGFALNPDVTIRDLVEAVDQRLIKITTLLTVLAIPNALDELPTSTMEDALLSILDIAEEARTLHGELAKRLRKEEQGDER